MKAALLLMLPLALMAEEAPVRWSAAAQGAMKPGATGAVRVAAKIAPTWHVYSLKQLPEGPKATRVTVAAGQPFTAAGEIKAPEPLRERDAAFDMEVEFYNDAVEFVVPVRAEPSARPGEARVRIDVRFQSCNGQICLPPTTVKLEAPVTISTP